MLTPRITETFNVRIVRKGISLKHCAIIAVLFMKLQVLIILHNHCCLSCSNHLPLTWLRKFQWMSIQWKLAEIKFWPNFSWCFNSYLFWCNLSAVEITSRSAEGFKESLWRSFIWMLLDSHWKPQQIYI